MSTGSRASLLCVLLACNAIFVQCAFDLKLDPEELDKKYFDGKKLNVPLGADGTHELNEHWMDQALSGLMAAVATQRAENIAHHHKEELFACSKKADNVHDHAKCVTRALDAPDHIGPKNIEAEKLKWEEAEEDVKQVGGFAMARNKRSAGPTVITRNSYNLMGSDDSPMSMIAKQLTKTVRKIKNKKGTENWHETILKVKRLDVVQKEEEKKRDALKNRIRAMIDAMPANMDVTQKKLMLKNIEEAEKKLDPMGKDPVAKQKAEAIRIPMRLLREAVKIGLQIAGKNTSDFNDKTIKMASPRFFSVVPDQENEEIVNMLSPSLFSLHEEGSEIEKDLSLPGLFRKMHLQGQESWLDFIIEASGVSDKVNEQLEEKDTEKKRNVELRGSRGEPLHFTKENVTEIYGDHEAKKVAVFEHLDKTYSKEQMGELDKQGFTFLSHNQLDVVYGDNSPFQHDEFLKGFKSINKEDQLNYILNNIRAIAEAGNHLNGSRVKRDIVASPFILQQLTFVGETLSQPVVLSPLVLSPIVLSPAVLGPITLSPWVFIPLILSPRVLSPLVLSPLVGSPIILSPLVLHPLILVPGVLNPFILSPFVLSPFILSPQALTPLILSPFALSPLILTPMVLSPLIGSPFVLSPLILSPQYLFAVVLSPYALSPLIESKLTASEVVLSPSWLS
ncbi:hypothetical protein L596_000543 [Steinernema carpocapsae]|uniref:Uncharacterized protein n=1 Tax=Steinernema carpocapsae TaxID=34508 RepID=A0A4U8UMN2_STECR|nr:hypothetical protein L596_000543 [Steinernema carpocapsae]